MGYYSTQFFPPTNGSHVTVKNTIHPANRRTHPKIKKDTCNKCPSWSYACSLAKVSEQSASPST